MNCEVLNQKTSLRDEREKEEMVLVIWKSIKMILEMLMINDYRLEMIFARMEDKKMKSARMRDQKTSTVKR
jgi:hypothetical protein